MTEPMDCKRCGKPHGKCVGHNRAGNPCGNGPLAGQRVCGIHGGKSPQALEAADRRLVEREAVRALEAFGVPIVIDYQSALLEELHRTAGAVAWLGAIVADLDQDDISWGKTRTKDAGDDRGTTFEAGKNVWVGLWQVERKHLVEVARECGKAKIDERRIELAEGQGRLLAGVIQRILTSVFESLVLVLGPHEAARVAVEAAWGSWVGSIVPAELRALSTVEGVDR